MPTPSVVASGTATGEPTANQSVPGSGVDNLAAELKALRLQAQNTEAELAKLQQQTPAWSAPQALGTSEAAMVFGSVALAFGLWVVFWRARRRRVVRRAAAPAATATAVESSFLPQTPAAKSVEPLPTRAQQPDPGASAAVSRSPTVAAVATPFTSQPVVHDSAFRPSSLDVSFVDQDSLDSSMMPLSSPRRDSPFGPPELGLAFDPEVAAGEVERVRKSLAAKRSERVRMPSLGAEIAWRDDDPADGPISLLQSDLLFASGPAVPPEAAGVDVLIDFPEPTAQSSPQELPADMTAAQTLRAREPDGELDVSVSLIQELRGLGLWSEARELAKEVVSTAQAPLDPDIATSLHKVQHGEPAGGAERRRKERG
ncbi:MAG: hypothetical protein IPO43_13770 [Rhodoferax sp.]|nr:hypothetical protein [Rhodoferax sp.]